MTTLRQQAQIAARAATVAGTGQASGFITPVVHRTGTGALAAARAALAGLGRLTSVINPPPPPANRPPVWTTVPSVTFAQGVASSFSLSSYVSDPDGDALTLSLGGLSPPPGVTLNVANKSLDYDGVGPVGSVSGVTILAEDQVSIVSFSLSSPVGGTLLPFTIGHAFAKGDVAGGQSVITNLVNSQFVIKSTWPDGSARHGILSGRVTLAANTPLTVDISTGTVPFRPALTEADLLTALNGQGTTSINCGATYGPEVTLQSLIGKTWRRDPTTGVRTSGLTEQFVSGPEMSEFHYAAMVGADAHLQAFFHVRLYASGKITTEVIVENGFTKVAGPAGKTIVPTVLINGVTVYTAASLYMQHHSRWSSQPQWHGPDPQITPAHDIVYLRNTRMVPPYGYFNQLADAITPTGSDLSGIWQSIPPSQNYLPMNRCNLPRAYDDTGSAPQIGVLPLWESLYCCSGSPIMYRATIANGYALGCYSKHYRDEITNRCIKFSDRPNAWINNGSTDSNALPNPTGTSPNVGDVASHQGGSLGFLPYLLTGRYFFLEEMQFVVSSNFMQISYGYRQGVKGIIDGQVRTWAWASLLLGQVASITPDADPLRAQYLFSYGANMSYYQAKYIDGTSHNGAFKNNLGVAFLPVYNGGSSTYTNGGQPDFIEAPWQQNMCSQSLGMVWRLEPALTPADKASQQALRDFCYKHIVGMFGDGVTGFCFRDFGAYTLVYGRAPLPPQSLIGAQWNADWLAVYNDTIRVTNVGTAPNFTFAQNACGPTVQPTDPWLGPPANWVNFGLHNDAMAYGALIFAVDDGAPGAQAGLDRISQVNNYNLIDAQLNKYPYQGGYKSFTIQSPL